jgi:phosphoenolpyruvate-protein phosphotransferase (PTS system enzyme I)
VRASLLEHSLDDARVIAEAALAATSAATAREAAREAASQHSSAAAI